MCGIAGLLGRSYARFAETVGPALKHRGPDGSGTWQEGTTQLLHHRLAIRDLSQAGSQPMESVDGRYVITFNGAIYNHRELRERLQQAGQQFRSSSDTELLLILFSIHREHMVTVIRGMFAFCIWDRLTQTAFFARDPLGIKPLYMWHGSDGSLAFASEVRSLLASGLIPRVVDREAMARYLFGGCLPQSDTLVSGVSAFPPGYCGRWHHHRWSRSRFWEPDYRSGADRDDQDLVLSVRTSLMESVQLHMDSEPAVALSFSGGMDSSALLVLSGGGVPCITIGFSEPGFDESSSSARVARELGIVDHRVLTVDRGSAQRLVFEFLGGLDQPSIDGFNVFCAARFAREEGFKVLLSGTGGDELFGGYPSFSKVPKQLATRIRLGDRAPALAKALAVRGDEGSQRMAALMAAPPGLAFASRINRAVFSPSEVASILKHWGMVPPAATRFTEDESMTTGPRFPTDQDRLAWLETTGFLGDRLLRDGDVCAMAHGVELRMPFVDSVLLDQLNSIPSASRLAPGKSLLARAVPELSRLGVTSSKKGFVPPFERWVEEDHSFLPSIPSIPESIDLRSWYRRLSLVALDHWTSSHLGFHLGPSPCGDRNPREAAQ